MILWNRASGLEPKFKNFEAEDKKDDDKNEDDDDEDDDAKARKKKEREKRDKEYHKAAKAEDDRKRGDFSNALDSLRKLLVDVQFTELTKHTIIVRCFNDGGGTHGDVLTDTFARYNSPYYEPRKSRREQLKNAKKREVEKRFISAPANIAGAMKAWNIAKPHTIQQLLPIGPKPSKLLLQAAKKVHEASGNMSLDDVRMISLLSAYILNKFSLGVGFYDNVHSGA